MKTLLFICLLLFAVVLIYYGIPWVYFQGLRYHYRRLTRKHSMLLLTYDDGPGKRLTPLVMNCLKQYHFPATFFVLGEHVRGCESLLDKLLQDGHQIGLHGCKHLHHWKVMPWTSIQDIRSGRKLLADCLKEPSGPLYFRPPYGKLNFFSLLYLRLCGILIVPWTIDGGDTWHQKDRDESEGANRLKEERGAVLLLHDNDRRLAETERFVLESTRKVIRQSLDLGLSSCTVHGFHQKMKTD